MTNSLITPPPPPPEPSQRVSQPPVATVSGRRLFYTNRHCVLRRRAPKPGETLPAYKSRGCVTPTADSPRVNPSLDKRGCPNCCWWRQDWVLVDAVADLGQGLEIDRNSFTNSSSRLSNNNGKRHTDVREANFYPKLFWNRELSGFLKLSQKPERNCWVEFEEIWSIIASASALVHIFIYRTLEQCIK